MQALYILLNKGLQDHRVYLCASIRTISTDELTRSKLDQVPSVQEHKGAKGGGKRPAQLEEGLYQRAWLLGK